MTYKNIDISSKRKPIFTDNDEDILIKAFEDFVPYDNINTGPVIEKKEHLGSEFKPGWSCEHRWQEVPKNEENKKFLQALYEEEDLGTVQKYCDRCGATSLWDNGLWAYDATIRFYGRVPKKSQKANRSPQKRS